MSTKSLAVAQYILDRCRESQDPSVTPMQLIKLVYVAHGYMLGEHGMPLLDEPVQAWQYGPVVSSVYQAVRHFRSSPVNDVRGASMWSGAFTKSETEVMAKVARSYGDFDGITLSAATHKPGTPWSVTWEINGKNSSISNDMIEHFYKKILSQESHSSL